jgi:RNA polymerase sigma-70 factor (ECF subfamily)
MSSSLAKLESLVDLLKQSGRGDSAAFGRLHARTAGPLLPVALRMVRNRDLSDEILQESFMVIWREACRFDCARAAPLTWMSTIVRNKAIDLLRSNRLRDGLTDLKWDEVAWESRSDPRDDPCDLAERGQRRRQIQTSLSTLGKAQRTAIELAFYDELSNSEVAREMTLPLGTIKSWIRRGCHRMRTDILLAGV